MAMVKKAKTKQKKQKKKTKTEEPNSIKGKLNVEQSHTLGNQELG